MSIDWPAAGRIQRAPEEEGVPDADRNMRGRRLALVVVVLALIVLGVSCGRAATPTPQQQIATIRFACLDEEIGYYEAQAQAFSAEHPEIRIQILPKRAQALAALGPGDSDVFMVSLPIEARLERGDLLSLEGWLADRDDFYPCTLAPFTHEGKLWALPVGVGPALMYYNKDLFDARQVPYPQPGWTWEDFLATARKLRGYRPNLYGYGAGLSPDEALLFVLQNGGRLVDDWQKPTRITFDDPQTVEALNWYVGLLYVHGVAPVPWAVEDDLGRRGVYGGVLDGKVAMWAAYFPQMDPEGKANWGAVVLPRGREQATLASVEAVAISAQAAHPEPCWQWVDFLSRQVPRRLAPPRRSVAESPAFADRAGADLAAAVRDSLEHALVLPRAPATFYKKLDELWAQALDDMLSGRFDPFHALQRVQQQAGKAP